METDISNVTPLPKGRIILLGSILLVNNASVFMIFSYLPFLVHDFFPHLSFTALGKPHYTFTQYL